MSPPWRSATTSRRSRGSERTSRARSRNASPTGRSKTWRQCGRRSRAGAGDILKVPGIREKTRDNILKGIATWRAGQSRMLVGKALDVADSLVHALKAHGGGTQIEVAGSTRRRKETVGDLDILVTSDDPERVIKTFVALPAALDVLAHGETKASIRPQEGIQVDLRVVEPEAFGAALQDFTGSKEHNLRIREIASKKGRKLSEYGGF